MADLCIYTTMLSVEGFNDHTIRRLAEEELRKRLWADGCTVVEAIQWNRMQQITEQGVVEVVGGMARGWVPSLIDPDCRDGKHRSCFGGPCECECHGQPADYDAGVS